MVNLSAYLKYKTKGDGLVRRKSCYVHTWYDEAGNAYPSRKTKEELSMDELRINEMNDYQSKTLRTWNTDESYNMRLLNAGAGLCGESGEVMDMLKKAIHHKHGFNGREKSIDKKDLAKELGDIMYYVSVGAHELGYTLQEIAEININKLAKRYPEGFSVEASINRVDTKEAH